MDLDERIYECHDCGSVMNRDLNAAINILHEGLKNTLGHRGIEACGDDTVSSVKQEKFS